MLRLCDCRWKILCVVRLNADTCIADGCAVAHGCARTVAPVLYVASRSTQAAPAPAPSAARTHICPHAAGRNERSAAAFENAPLLAPGPPDKGRGGSQAAWSPEPRRHADAPSMRSGHRPGDPHDPPPHVAGSRHGHSPPFAAPHSAQAAGPYGIAPSATPRPPSAVPEFNRQVRDISLVLHLVSSCLQSYT